MGLNLLVILPIALPLLGALLEALLARMLSGKAKGWLAFSATLGALASVIALYPATLAGRASELTLGAWDGPASLAFYVDGVSQLFALMAASIGAAVLLYAVEYMSHERSSTRFYIIMQVFIAGFITFVYARDLLLLYAGWEIIGLCSFLLVGFWYTQPAAAAGARKVLVMTHLAGYGLLAAILVLFARTGTMLWTDPRIGDAFTTGLFALLVVAAAAKSVQFPLHTWIASAMSAPTPVSALLHSACYVTAGVYLIARTHSIVAWPVGWQTAVVWLGTATMLVGVLFAMVQSDAKRMLAFSTVSQIGYMVVGLGLGTPLGIAAGLFHCLNHGLFKASLFLGAGAVQHATGTRDMDKLGGLMRRMPATATLWLVSSAAIAGVPLLNGFVSKWLLYVAALDAGYTAPALIAWIVSAMTMFTFMKASSSMFFGEDGEASSKAHESPRGMLVGSGVLVVCSIVLGVAPQFGLKFFIAPALSSLGLSHDLGVSWLGFAANQGSWYTTIGLLLAALSIMAGGAAYWLSTRRERRLPAVRPAEIGIPRLAIAGTPDLSGLQILSVASTGAATSEPFTGGAPLSATGRIDSSDFSAAITAGIGPFYRWFDPDRYFLAIWHWTLGVVTAVSRLCDVLERRAVIALTGIAVVVGAIGGLASGVQRTEHAEVVAVDVWPISCAVAVALGALLLASSALPHLRKQTWLLVLSGGLALGALSGQSEIVSLIALECAALTAFLALVFSGVPRQAQIAYLAALVLSAAALVTGTLLVDSAPGQLVLGLFLAGFAVKLALVPAYLWLPIVAERTPAPLVGLIIAVVDVAAFSELITLRVHAAWLFEPSWPWITLAAVSAIGGAGLALAQKDVKRFLAFSTITDAGFILIGVTVGGALGLTGAVIGASVHALAKALLFTCVSAADADNPLTLASRGIAHRHPLAAAGFVAGSLAALGVPPTAGFAGHWRLYSAALSVSPAILAVLVLATILSVLAYARIIALVWWGGPDSDEAAALTRTPSVWTAEGIAVTVPIAVLTATVLILGLWPQAF